MAELPEDRVPYQGPPPNIPEDCMPYQGPPPNIHETCLPYQHPPPDILEDHMPYQDPLPMIPEDQVPYQDPLPYQGPPPNIPEDRVPHRGPPPNIPEQRTNGWRGTSHNKTLQDYLPKDYLPRPMQNGHTRQHGRGQNPSVIPHRNRDRPDNGMFDHTGQYQLVNGQNLSVINHRNHNGNNSTVGHTGQNQPANDHGNQIPNGENHMTGYPGQNSNGHNHRYQHYTGGNARSSYNSQTSSDDLRLVPEHRYPRNNGDRNNRKQNRRRPNKPQNEQAPPQNGQGPNKNGKSTKKRADNDEGLCENEQCPCHTGQGPCTSRRSPLHVDTRTPLLYNNQPHHVYAPPGLYHPGNLHSDGPTMPVMTFPQYHHTMHQINNLIQTTAPPINPGQPATNAIPIPLAQYPYQPCTPHNYMMPSMPPPIQSIHRPPIQGIHQQPFQGIHRPPTPGIQTPVQGIQPAPVQGIQPTQEMNVMHTANMDAFNGQMPVWMAQQVPMGPFVPHLPLQPGLPYPATNGDSYAPPFGMHNNAAFDFYNGSHYIPTPVTSGCRAKTSTPNYRSPTPLLVSTFSPINPLAQHRLLSPPSVKVRCINGIFYELKDVHGTTHFEEVKPKANIQATPCIPISQADISRPPPELHRLANFKVNTSEAGNMGQLQKTDASKPSAAITSDANTSKPSPAITSDANTSKPSPAITSDANTLIGLDMSKLDEALTHVQNDNVNRSEIADEAIISASVGIKSNKDPESIAAKNKRNLCENNKAVDMNHTFVDTDHCQSVDISSKSVDPVQSQPINTTCQCQPVVNTVQCQPIDMVRCKSVDCCKAIGTVQSKHVDTVHFESVNTVNKAIGKVKSEHVDTVHFESINTVNRESMDTHLPANGVNNPHEISTSSNSDGHNPAVTTTTPVVAPPQLQRPRRFRKNNKNNKKPLKSDQNNNNNNNKPDKNNKPGKPGPKQNP